MNLILTDDPTETAHLLPPCCQGPTWSPQTSLAPHDRELSEALGAGATPWGLQPVGLDGPARFWSRLVAITDAPGSQFDLLRDRLHECVGQVGPLACVALGGRNFHGQRGRAWSAVRGNLHLSVAFSPELAAGRYGPSMTMLPAVAVIDALAAVGATWPPAGIKWVNDILIDGRKVAGVITATRVMGDRLDLVVLGIGINVLVAPEVEPTPFVPGVCCLQGPVGAEPPDLGRVLWAVLDALALRIQALVTDGPPGLFAAYRERSLVLGRRVRIWEEGATDGRPPAAWPPATASGRVLDLGPDLRLRIEGRDEPVDRGRLAFEEACREVGL